MNPIMEINNENKDKINNEVSFEEDDISFKHSMLVAGFDRSNSEISKKYTKRSDTLLSNDTLNEFEDKNKNVNENELVEEKINNYQKDKLDSNQLETKNLTKFVINMLKDNQKHSKELKQNLTNDNKNIK